MLESWNLCSNLQTTRLPRVVNLVDSNPFSDLLVDRESKGGNLKKQQSNQASHRFEDVCQLLPSWKMSDHVTREFRAQLTTAMDSIMRRTMFEVMKIFDNSLSDFKLELVQKGEEIAHLKVKLQKAEVRLKDVKCSDDKAEERNTSRKNQLDKDPDKVPHLSEQPSVVPEFDFEGKT